MTVHGKLCLVTGASSGIGKATAIRLARAQAHVVIVCRDEATGRRAVKEIGHASNHSGVDLLVADLASQRQIRTATSQFLRRYSALDVLIHNAGVIMPRRVLTEDGVETTFAINHLAPFLLTQLLLCPLLSSRGRILLVASRAEGLGKIQFDDLHYEHRYHWFKCYCQSKLANLLFTYELDRRLQGTGATVNAMHPGLIASNLGRHLGRALSCLLLPLHLFMRSPEHASKALFELVSDENRRDISGKYFINGRERKSSPQSYDRETALRLWQVSEVLTQLRQRQALEPI